jgi:hypothetical protein
MTKIIVKLKTKEKLKGGKGDERPDSDFNKKDLEDGIKHEMEHTKDRSIAKEIAKDHLSEDPNYYKIINRVMSFLNKIRKTEK